MERDEPRSRWSWRLGRPFGIQIRVHATFLLLLVWVAGTHLMQRQGWTLALGGVVYVLAIFAIVVIHELAHALMARRFGIGTRDILLLPIGGVSHLERMPTKPSQELLVALAGPLVNIVLAGVLLGVLVVTGSLSNALAWTLVGGPFVAKLMWTNVALAGFNLLPAFPMDGGRVLRGLLAMRMEHMRATDVAAAIGRAAAVGFAVIGLFFNPLLLFIALFVWVGAKAEAKLEHTRASLAGVRVRDAMVHHVVAVTPNEPLSSVGASMLEGFQDDVPVVQAGHLVGMLDRDDVMRAMASGDPGAPVASVMRREDLAVVTDEDPLEAALEQLARTGRRSIPVVHGDILVGLLPIENIAYVQQMHERTAP
jgi:Zn-dependent protease/CBS domain-containing protein